MSKKGGGGDENTQRDCRKLQVSSGVFHMSGLIQYTIRCQLPFASLCKASCAAMSNADSAYLLTARINLTCNWFRNTRDTHLCKSIQQRNQSTLSSETCNIYQELWLRTVVTVIHTHQTSLTHEGTRERLSGRECIDVTGGIPPPEN